MTEKTQPTDAELKAMWQPHAADIGGIFYYARAVLAKWGTPAQAAEPVAWLDPWTGTRVTTDYDAYGKHGTPLYTTPQPVAREPVAWKHDCAALLTNDVELWIDACPHCGKPRNAPPPVEREPLTRERVKEIVRGAGYDQCGIPDTERAAFINGKTNAGESHDET